MCCAPALGRKFSLLRVEFGNVQYVDKAPAPKGANALYPPRPYSAVTIASFGTDPFGDTEGWIATIPEPSTALLLGLGLLGLASYRRGRVLR